MPIVLNLDPEMEGRLSRLAEARHKTPEAVLREALAQYLKREESFEGAGGDPQDRHPSGKPWPRRSPVGGIITPL